MSPGPAANQEQRPDIIAPLPLSEVRRRQRRLGPLMLLMIVVCVASQFGAIALIRPLMVKRSDWYGLLLILYVFLSFGLMGYGILRVHRWFGLQCPYCGTTFIWVDLKGRNKDPVVHAQEQQQCSSCRAVMIDIDA
jgi:hypothetical protein